MLVDMSNLQEIKIICNGAICELYLAGEKTDFGNALVFEFHKELRPITGIQIVPSADENKLAEIVFTYDPPEGT